MSIEAPLVFLADADVVLSFVENDQAHQRVAAAVVRSLHEGVVVFIVDQADLDAAEVMAEVRVAHPEKTLLVIVSSLALDVWGPKIGRV